MEVENLKWREDRLVGFTHSLLVLGFVLQIFLVGNVSWIWTRAGAGTRDLRFEFDLQFDLSLFDLRASLTFSDHQELVGGHFYCQMYICFFLIA